MAEPELRFDQPSHTYTLGDRVLPSVTQIIRSAGLVDSTWFTDKGRQIGEDVAVITELYDNGDPRFEPVLAACPETRPYVEAWQAFLEASVFDVKAIEERVYDPAAWYAGTLDRAGYLMGRWTIVDIKKYAHVGWHGVQLAGYAKTFGGPVRRLGVHLKKDGTYKIHQFDDDADYDIWLAIVRQFHGRDMPGDAKAIRTWKTNHGVKT